jgi:hypothetical protein
MSADIRGKSCATTAAMSRMSRFKVDRRYSRGLSTSASQTLTKDAV